MSRPRLVLFVVLCLAQLAIPLSMAYRYERTLRAGTLYRFHTEPFDPVDAFRGRYVAIRLRLVAEGGPALIVDPPKRGGQIYVLLGEDAAGFATARELRRDRPSGGDWLAGTLAQLVWEDGFLDQPVPRRPIGTRIDLPFDRYYMEETKAPAADRIWSEGMQQAEATARVRVRKGMGAIEGLDVNGVPIERWIATLPPKQ